MAAMDPEQARRFLNVARGTPLEALWVLAVTTGLRQGELLALRWSEVDLEGASVRVTGTLTRINVEVAEQVTRRPTASSPLQSQPGRGAVWRSELELLTRFASIDAARSSSVCTLGRSGSIAIWCSVEQRAATCTPCNSIANCGRFSRSRGFR